MNNIEIIKYFYEVVVSKNLLHELPSKNLLHELPQYISKDCVEGMRQHLLAVKQTYPDYNRDYPSI